MAGYRLLAIAIIHDALNHFAEDAAPNPLAVIPTEPVAYLKHLVEKRDTVRSQRTAGRFLLFRRDAIKRHWFGLIQLPMDIFRDQPRFLERFRELQTREEDLATLITAATIAAHGVDTAGPKRPRILPS